MIGGGCCLGPMRRNEPNGPYTEVKKRENGRRVARKGGGVPRSHHHHHPTIQFPTSPPLLSRMLSAVAVVVYSQVVYASRVALLQRKNDKIKLWLYWRTDYLSGGIAVTTTTKQQQPSSSSSSSMFLCPCISTNQQNALRDRNTQFMMACSNKRRGKTA